MKSKLSTYLLILAVMVLWGIIVKKMFFSQKATITPVIVDTATAVIPEEEEKLDLDYRDPFREKPHRTSVGTAAVAPPLPLNPVGEKFEMKFLGRLKSGKITNYIIEAAGDIEALSLNEELKGFKLIRVSADSLYFKKNGHTYTLPAE